MDQVKTCMACLCLILVLAGTVGWAESKKHIDHPTASHPVIPGESRVEQGSIEHGELLLGALNCVGCHTTSDEALGRLPMKQPPILGNMGARITPQYLRAYLSNPHGIKPGTTMPDVLHASAAQSKAAAIDYLMHFLLSQGGPVQPSKIGADEGLINRGKELYHTVGCVACHSPQAASAEFNKESGSDDYGDDGPQGKAAALKHPSVPLGKDFATKTTVEQLASFLLAPLKTRPSGRMPNLGLAKDEATAVAAYLLREQAYDNSVAEARVAGLKYEYYEGGVSGDEPKWESMTAKAKDRKSVV